MTFPLLIPVLLLDKVWSPQSSLSLLPWFALTRVPFATFFAYQLGEILEILTRYSHLSHLQTGRGVPYAVLAVVSSRALRSCAGTCSPGDTNRPS